MSESNKSLCRRLYEDVWNNRNFKAVDELFTANYTDHDPNSPGFGRGPEGVRKLLNYYTGAFPDSRFTIEDILSDDDRCAVRWTVRGTHRGELGGVQPTGKQVTITGVTVLRITNGKISESYVNWDALGLMQQLGVVKPTMAGRATA